MAGRVGSRLCARAVVAARPIPAIGSSGTASSSSQGCRRLSAAALSQVDRAGALGLVLPAASDITPVDYGPEYRPPAQLTCGLLMVPHGQTPSNERMLFQSHRDGPENALTQKGVAMAERGAVAFARDYGPLIRAQPESWMFYRSPLSRTETTARSYTRALREAGVDVPDPIVDPDLIEINQGSWHGLSVGGLAGMSGGGAESAMALRYRDGCFVAKALDGSGESRLDVMTRVASWLRRLEELHGGRRRNIVVFGHGTFQNSVEVLLRSIPGKSPVEVFSRNVSGSSHLRRGEVHVLAPTL